jgi:hypothetical protein
MYPPLHPISNEDGVTARGYGAVTVAEVLDA